MDVGLAWAEFAQTRSEAARNALISNYMPLVRVVAGRVGTTLPSSVDREDLNSYGVFGLIDAIQRFDLDRGVKFETYAVTRIRGAIIDELRALDWVPRSVRSRQRDMERATARLENELGRSPSEPELAGAMELELGELRHFTANGTGLVAYLDEMTEDWDSGLLKDAAANPEDQFVATTEVTSVVGEAIAGLPERSRVIACLYYVHGMTLAEIGQVLGVTESRVCQLQSRLLQELRDAFGQGLAA